MKKIYLILLPILVFAGAFYFNLSPERAESQGFPEGCNAQKSALLGSWSDKSIGGQLIGGTRIMRGEAGVPLSQASTNNYGATHIVEQPVNVGMTVTALDPLPPGLRIATEPVQYVNPINGETQWTRYIVTGTPTQLGNTSVRIQASSPTCGSETGLINFQIYPAAVSCTIDYNKPVNVGESATLIWTLKGEVANGSISPSIQGFPNIASERSVKTNPLNTDTKFTLSIVGKSGTDNSCQVTVKVGGSSGSKIKLIKTILDIPFDQWRIGSVIGDALFSGNHFVLSGARCTESSGGEGLWFVNEDGSGITSRQACVDAGSGVNSSPYQHGSASSHRIFPEWGSGGFIRENAVSAGNCLVEGAEPYDCKVLGPGANRAVYYSSAGLPISTSPLHTYNISPMGLKGRVISRTGSHNYLVSLPDWKLRGVVSQSGIGFGDFIFTPGSIYSVSEFGFTSKVKELTNEIYTYAFDNSTTPSRMAIYESGVSQTGTRKMLIYRLTGENVELDKTIDLPSEFPKSQSYRYNANSFGVWGDYFVVTGSTRGTLELWKNTEKIDSIRIQSGDYVNKIVISKNGYVAVSVGKTVYLYQIGDVPPPTTPTPPSPPGGQGPGNGGQLYDHTSVDCEGTYAGNDSLVNLCKYVVFVQQRACSVVPWLPQCAAFNQ